MKNNFNLKILFTTILASIVSFFSKVAGQSSNNITNGFGYELGTQQDIYGAPLPFSRHSRVLAGILIIVAFIIGIISFIKIKKIENNDLKHKKIKKAIISISILIFLIIACIIITKIL